MKSAGTSTLLYFYKPRKLPRIWGAVTPQLFKPERTHCPSNSPFSQSCTVTKSEKFWQATGQSNYWQRQLAATKAPNFGFLTHTTTLWPMEQSAILCAKFDCSVVYQNFSLVATVHDCETGLFRNRYLWGIQCRGLLHFVLN